VRVIQKAEEPKVSTEERLKIVEGQLGSVQDELSKIRQMLSKLVEKGAEGSPSDPLTKGDILDAVMVRPPSAQGEDDRGNQAGSGDKDEGENEGRGEGEDENEDESG
jgi:hypothetical protein